jgi:hypothetical protein
MAFRNGLIDAELRNVNFMYGMGVNFTPLTATGTVTMGASWAPFQDIDPGGADRTVLLPPEAGVPMKMFVIRNNADADEALTIKDDGNATTFAVLEMGEAGWFYCNGTTWKLLARSFGTATGSIGEEVTVKVALTAATVTTGGAVLSWANPVGSSIIISRFKIYISTGSTGAATLDIGIAADGTTSNDTLLDGYNAQTTGVADNIENQGTNGVSAKLMTSTQFITATASATVAGLVGSAYITYHRI